MEIQSAGVAGDGRGDLVFEGIGQIDPIFPEQDWNIVRDDFNGFLDGFRWDVLAPDTGASSIADAAGGELQILPSDGSVVANDEIYISSDGETWEFVADKPGFWEWEIRVDEASVDQAGIFVGLSDTVTMIADATLAPVAAYLGAGFYKPHSDLVFHTQTNDGAADDVQVVAQTAWVDGQQYRLAIEYLPDPVEAVINFYLDGVLIDTKGFTVAAAALMHTIMGIKNEAANNNTLAIRRFYGRQAH